MLPEAKMQPGNLIQHLDDGAIGRAPHADKLGHAFAVGDHREVIIEQARLEIDAVIWQVMRRRVKRAVAGRAIVGVADLYHAFVTQVLEAAEEWIAKRSGHDGAPKYEGHPVQAVTLKVVGVVRSSRNRPTTAAFLRPR